MAAWIDSVLGMFKSEQPVVQPRQRARHRLAPLRTDDKVSKRMAIASKAMDEIRADNSTLQNAMARAYDGAEASLTKASWSGVQSTANEEVRRALYRLRARSRDLSQNNDYMRKILSMHVNNVVGPDGFTLKVLARDPKSNAVLTAQNAIIRKGFADWSGRSACDITGRFSLAEMCRILFRSVVRDGEGLVRVIRGSKKTVGNKFGLALQIIETDRLDINRSTFLDNGNRVVMGVEINSYGKPVAYYIFNEVEPLFQGSVQAGFKSERVPAEEIFHLYSAERPEQQRGVPWCASAMSSLYHLDQMQEAALVAARVGASRMGFIETPDGNASPLADGSDDVGNLYEDFAPGKIGVLPPGYKYTEGAGSYPDQGYAPFILQGLRSVASSVSIAYHSLGNDLTAVSFSSIRSGTIEERDHWKTVQAWFIDVFLTPLYSVWLEQAMLNNALTYGPGGMPLKLEEFDLFDCPQWVGRRWGYIDPLKDINAEVVGINNGLNSRSNVMAEMGRDKDDTWHELSEEAKEAEAMGLTIEGLNAAETLTPTQNEQGAPAAEDAPNSEKE
jgi:lambda family phage portal protein